MTRVLQVFNRYQERSGEELIVFELEEALIKRDDIVPSLFMADSREWAGHKGPWWPVKLWKMFFNKAIERQLCHLIQSDQIDVMIVHNVYPILSPAVYAAARKSNIPVIQYLHNYRPFSVGGSLWSGHHLIDAGLRGKHWPEIRAKSWQNSFFKSLFMGIILKRFVNSSGINSITRWVACSDFVNRKFLSAGIDDQKIVTIRHGWESMEKAPEIWDDGYYLLIARLVPEKGIETAINAWEVLERKLGDACPKLIIAGAGSEEDRVRFAVGKLKSIRFVGYVSGRRKDRLLRRCRAPLAPSVWWEPLGLVTYEAYDYGKPMMAAASGGLKETIIDGVTGFLHEAGNADDLAQSVIKMEAKTPRERLEMGEKGRAWLLTEANYEKWVSRVAELIQEVKNPS
ncbi:MAG: glycosyltransferase family 4 protein [Verrucomicrobiae bacterium]|nr:glycosyltransferase family 4 protein [Verrucomicrobiae bacterium]NNJ42530.1 glycosyltransferase family 4 protein [Akkermansiaceae bacterium]